MLMTCVHYVLSMQTLDKCDGFEVNFNAELVTWTDSFSDIFMGRTFTFHKQKLQEMRMIGHSILRYRIRPRSLKIQRNLDNYPGF